MHKDNGEFKLIQMRFVIVLLLLSFSCGKEKSIQLPEISHSNIQEVKDVATAYIFYDENKKDSVDLKRKNFANSTNLLVNVDKHLLLRQVIPAIQSLQKKKQESLHNNETSKNFYSCHDTSVKELGFIDFTDVVYHNGIDGNIVENQDLYDVQIDETNHILSLVFKENDSITINSAHSTKDEFVGRLKYMDSLQDKIMGIVYLKFDENLTFQDYITYKSLLSKLKLEHAIISNDEYIFN